VAKLIILSIVLASFVLPVWLSTKPPPRRTIRRLQWTMFFFVIVWAYMCLRWYPLVVPLK
jgi:hypothetical protein